MLLSLTLASLLFAAISANQIICSRYTSSLSRGNKTFQPLALQTISDSLLTNSFSPKLPNTITLPPGRSWSTGTQVAGGYQLCVSNMYLFTSVSVNITALGEAVSRINETCCGSHATGPTGPAGPAPLGTLAEGCLDGRTVVDGKGGSVDLVGQSLDERCCGLWGCL